MIDLLSSTELVAELTNNPATASLMQLEDTELLKDIHRERIRNGYPAGIVGLYLRFADKASSDPNAWPAV